MVAKEITPQEHRLQMERMGRKEYVLMKMIEYGFWPQGIPTPIERQQNESSEQFQERTRLLTEFQLLAKDIADAGADINKINAEIVRVRQAYKKTYLPLEKIKRIVANEIMAESKKRRAERKTKREQEQKVRHDEWKKRMAGDILFIGRGYSGRLSDKQTSRARLSDAGLPVIATGKELADCIGISFSQLRFLSYHRDAMVKDNYKRYTIPKKRGGTRTIAAPMPLLKHTQRQVLDTILAKIASPKHAHGFIQGKSVMTNATVHTGSTPGASKTTGPALVINIDLKDFFPTISYERVQGMFQKLGYSGQIASILAMICTDCNREPIEVNGKVMFVATERRKLPQGSPASPAITNILCRRMDNRLHGLAAKQGFTYTRYADDLTFSTTTAKETTVLGKFCFRVTKIVEAEGFQVNETKTRFMRKSCRQEITGIIVNSGSGGIARPWIKKFRAAIHNASKLVQAQGGTLPIENCNELRGMAAWAHVVDPKRYKKLIDGAHALLASQKITNPPKKNTKIKVPGGILQDGKVTATPPAVKPVDATTVGPMQTSLGTGSGFSIKGKAVYITGVVPGYTKNEVEKLVKDYGGIWKSFGKNLDLLVIGDKPGPAKLQKAAQFGLTTMSLAEFFKRLGVWK